VDHRTDITIEILENLQAKNDPEVVHKFFLNSLEWKSNYRDFYNSQPWSWTWHKVKQLIKPVNADTIDTILYITHDNYQGAIGYILREIGEIQKIKSDISIKAKLIKKEKFENIQVSLYFDNGFCIKTSEEESRFAVIIMNKTDYENGYDLN